MKKYLFLPFLLLTGFALLFSSCNNEDDATKTLSFAVQVTMPGGFKSDVHYAGQLVKIAKGDKVYTATTDSQGIARFEQIIPDVYDLSTTWEIPGEDYVQKADSLVQNTDVVLTGTLAGEIIMSNDTIVLPTTLSVKQGLLISKIYYAGRKDTLNKNYTADQYIELFNNSDKDISIDSLYFAMVESESTPAFPASGKTGYIYAKQVFQIPAGETKHIVSPGKTVLIVNSAINHKATVTTSIDLSMANFEAKNSKNNNNASVEGLKLIHTAYSTIPSINFLTGGDASVVLFRTNQNVSAYQTTYKPGATSGNLFMKIPAQTVIDGVECLKNKTATGPDATAKRLYNSIDAGYKYISAVSGYTGEVLVRKKASEANGRVYLTDTNNSSNDFVVSTTVLPGQFIAE